ncbi:hypothetical protein HY988_04675 [Candidatus Micrarchaeota archaeon]|nr:hypothetical protein [Candidatus Micrarchaeota archaeon]
MFIFQFKPLVVETKSPKIWSIGAIQKEIGANCQEELARQILKITEPNKIKQKIAAVKTAIQTIAKVFGDSTGYVIRALESDKLAEFFIRDPKKATDIFVEFYKAAGDRAWHIFLSFTAHEKSAELFTKYPYRFVELVKAAGTGITLIAFENDKIAHSFVKEPKKIVDAFIVILKAAKNFRGSIFPAFKNDTLSEYFIKDPKRFADQFADIIKSVGKNQNDVFEVLASDKIARLFVKYPDQFIQLARVAKDHTSYVFKSLANDLILDPFIKDPKKFTDAFVEMTKIAGVHAIHALYLLRNPEVREFFANSSSTFKRIVRARAFARQLGVSQDGEILLNLVWGLTILGEEKIKTLYQAFGITYFLRYTKNTLDETYKNAISNSDKPVALIVFNKCDFDGAFYREGLTLDGLTKFYRVVIVETDNEKDFYERVEATGKSKKISLLIIGGHGTPQSIRLGGKHIEPDSVNLSDEEKLDGRYELDLTDEEEIKHRNIRQWMAPNSTIALIACATGLLESSIGAMISSSFGAKILYAPRFNSSETVFHLSYEGELDTVTYNVPVSTFSEGRLVSLKPNK